LLITLFTHTQLPPPCTLINPNIFSQVSLAFIRKFLPKSIIAATGKGMNVTYKDLKVGAFITTQFYFYRWLHMKKNTGAGVGKIAGTMSSYDVVSESEFVLCLCVI
jgi:hypothetical protein